MSLENIFFEARKLMVSLDINSLPVNPFLIARKLNIPIYTYAEAIDLGFISEIIKLRKIKADAFCYKSPSAEYIIFYDEQISPPERINFTLAHEFGHIFLKHHDHNGILPRYLVLKKYDPLETSADHFAGELIRPSILLTLIGIEHVSSIAAICNITSSAARIAERQICSLKNRISSPWYKKHFQFYQKQFHDFIHQKHCIVCHYEFIAEHSTFCPICGNNELKWGKDKIPMHYKTYQYSHEGKVLQCVRCENEDIEEEHTFCIICGAKTSNSCYGLWIEGQNGYDGYYEESKSCKRTLPPNARFCPYCGGISEYFFHEIIKPWEDEYKELKKQGENNNIPPF